MTKKQKPKINRWMCIRSCYDRDCRTWNVGDVIKADEAPMPRHFTLLGKNDQADPITAMREKIEELDLDWDENWSLDRLTREVEVAEDWLRRKKEAEERLAKTEKE